MLGSVSDAEDIVQETWLRWTPMDTEKIRKSKSWLLTVVSRLCLDHIKSARVQRERYYGVWLPEPVIEDSASGFSNTNMDESVSMGLLLVLEKLSPDERIGFLLHEVFACRFREIAVILGKPEASCRKLVSRARARVRSEKPRFEITAEEHEELLRCFLKACREGDLESLMELLWDSAALYSDGGGKVSAVPRVLVGDDKVARFFIKIAAAGGLKGDTADIRFRFFNGSPGVLVFMDERLVTALTLEIRNGGIWAIFVQRNPDKLKQLEKMPRSDERK